MQQDDCFGSSQITVTLTGEEWFAIISEIGGKALGPEGRKLYREAAKKLGDQVVIAASKLSAA